jgi:hypothetical protein
MLIDDLVLVKLYVMLGDGDSSIRGFKILRKQSWEEDFERFQSHLKTNNLTHIERESEFFGTYYVDSSAYDVKEITIKEAQVIAKFFGETDGVFRMPSYFIDGY